MLSVEQLREHIGAGNFEALVGEIETEAFDCKREPYRVENDKGRRELAKDVSSFANARGGYVLVGMATRKNDVHLKDEVEKACPFEQSLVDAEQYYNLLRSWIYPEVEGLRISWVASGADSTKGILVIEVPEQKAALKPFLIKNVIDNGGKKVEVMFGYAERRRDNSQPLSVIDLQRALRLGMSYERAVSERFDALEMQLKKFADGSTLQGREVSEENINKRIEDALAHENIGEKRVMVLTAYPAQPGELETIFTTAEGSIRRHLERPPVLRYGGWQLETQGSTKILRGELVRAETDNYKLLDLYRDGTLVFVCRADGDFLCWASDSMRINPVALVEVVYNFASFYKLVLDDLGERPSGFSVRIELRNMHLDGVKNQLAPNAAGSFEHRSGYGGRVAPDDRMAVVRKIDADNYDAGRVAFQILREIYSWFGLEEDKVPYTTRDGTGAAVDPAQIVNLD